MRLSTSERTSLGRGGERGVRRTDQPTLQRGLLAGGRGEAGPRAVSRQPPPQLVTRRLVGGAPRRLPRIPSSPSGGLNAAF